MRLSRMLLPTLMVVALSAAACSSSTSPAGSVADAAPKSCSFDKTVQGVTATQQAGQPPELVIAADAKPPKDLVAVDLCVGEGSTIQPTDVVVANYVGAAYSSKQVFESSFGQAPFTTPLSGVIQGWTNGIPGMKPGGARLLLIPGPLAYGKNPPPGSPFVPNEALAFIVEIDQVNPSAPAPS